MKAQAPQVEYASMAGRNASPYLDLHHRTGISVRHITNLAAENRLGELFTSDGKLIGDIPQSPNELRKRVQELRFADWIGDDMPGKLASQGIPGRLARQIAQAKSLRWPAKSQIGSTLPICKLNRITE